MPRGVMGAVEAASRSQGGGDELIVEQDARAIIRLLGDGGAEDVLFGVFNFHASGNATSFEDKGICLRELGEDCRWCAENLQRRAMLVCWVWVKSIIHPQQKLSTWEPVEIRGRGRAFKEDVNAPKILRKGIGKGRAFLELFVNYFQEYGALNNRDYVLSRTGAGFDTNYSLVPRGDASALTPDQERAKSQCKDILEYYRDQAAGRAAVATDNTIDLEDEEDDDGDEPPF